MKKCISYWSLQDGLAGNHSIEAAIQDTQAAGFQGLELAIGDQGVVNTELTQDECEAIRRQIDESGLTVETLASGMAWAFNPISDDADVRSQSLALHKQALQRAAWLGCQALLVVPAVVRSPIAPQECIRYDIALERVRESVSQLLETATQVGVDLCLENVWNGLFYSPVELLNFIDSFNSDRLGVYFDVGNVLGYQGWPPHWIQLLGNRIKRVHIKDYQENFDWHGTYHFCDLLEGDVPWPETMAALKSIGYSGTIVAEMLPHSEGLLERTSKAMDKILAM